MPPSMLAAGSAEPGPAAPQRRRLSRADAPGSRDRDFWVYAPRPERSCGLLGRPAVLMVLHGCRQNAAEIMAASRFVEIAADEGTVLVFPDVTSWPAIPRRASNCWGFWIPAERRRGEGEVGDLRRIFAAVDEEFGTDPSRRYVAGLSSGGAMAVAMAVVYGDAVRAAAAVAGLAYGETRAAATPAGTVPNLCPWFLSDDLFRPAPRLRPLQGLVRDMVTAHERAGQETPVPLLVMQSTRDRVVRVENARMLRDVWIARHGADPDCAELLRTGWPVEHRRHLDGSGRTLVETVFYEGRTEEPTHYWPGDHDCPPFAHPDGPSATEALMNFFHRHGL